MNDTIDLTYTLQLHSATACSKTCALFVRQLWRSCNINCLVVDISAKEMLELRF